MSNEYAFPEVYISGIKGKRCLCVKDREALVVSCEKDPQFCSEVYGHIAFERALEYIDQINAKVLSSIAILKSKPDEPVYEGLLIEQNTSVCLQEVEGEHVYFLVKEGMRINRGSVVAYIVTNKLEIRSVRSLCKGLIALIVDLSWETPRKGILVVTDVYRQLTARKSA